MPGIGIGICTESGKVVKECKEFIGTATNNIASIRTGEQLSSKRNKMLLSKTKREAIGKACAKGGLIKRADNLANLAIDDFI